MSTWGICLLRNQDCNQYNLPLNRKVNASSIKKIYSFIIYQSNLFHMDDQVSQGQDSLLSWLDLFGQSNQIADYAIHLIILATHKQIQINQIQTQIPTHSLTNMIQLVDHILEMELFDSQDPIDVQYIQDTEPNPPIEETWRRVQATVQINQVVLIEHRNKPKKKAHHFFTSSIPSNSIQASQMSNPQSQYSPKSSILSSGSPRSPFTPADELNVDIQEQPQPKASVWENDEYKYEFVDMSVPTELDPIDEQLRLQYVYEIEQRAERDKFLGEREEQHQAEMKILKNISLSKNKVTFDYDGRLLVVEKMKKKKLGQINPKMQIEYGKTESNGIIQEDPADSEKEREQKEEEEKKKKKKFIPKPGLQRFNMIVNQKTQKDPALEIIKQQETNLSQIYLDQFHMKPGVALQLGVNHKMMPKSTSASQLPYTVQAKMSKYLGENESTQLKLTKKEYEAIVLKNGNIGSLYSNQQQ